MRKIILLIFLVPLFFIFTNSKVNAAKINPTYVSGYNKCHFCPVLTDHPEYGTGTTLACQDQDNAEYCLNDGNHTPLGVSSLSEINSIYCLYDPPEPGPGIPNYVTNGDEMDACTGVNECNEANGCGTSNPNPDQCLAVGGSTCTSQEECKKGGQCSSYWCVSAAGLLYAEGQSADGTCRFSNEEPLPGQFADCNTKPCAPGYTCVGTSPNKFCDVGTNLNLQSNDPLSLPCPKSGSFYSDLRGCFRIKTAFGMVSTGATDFTRWALGFVLSIGGGIVFIIILVAGYKLMTSQGDPDKVKNAREQLTAAIVGFIFIIFSLVILELITRDILGLPGFGR